MATNDTVRVWDPLVRIFHWSLVLFFTVAYFIGEDESLWHIYSGYIVGGLVIFRIVWGFIGTRHARFSDFVSSPAKVLEYGRSLLKGRPIHYLGHNPAGGYMVLALLVMLSITTLSGLELYAAEEGKGPFAEALTLVPAAYADEEEYGEEGGEEVWEEIHELASNLTVLLVILHIAGVAVSSVLHRENQVRAMITGRKPRPDDYNPD